MSYVRAKIDADELFTNQVNMVSAGVNPRQALREAVQNAIEAGLRFIKKHNLSAEAAKRYLQIRIQRDWQNPIKLAVVNVGLAITEDEADINLMNVAYSGNKGYHDKDKEYDPNKGIGIKITVLPFAIEGFVMRSWSGSPEDSFQFQVGTRVNVDYAVDGTYGFYFHPVEGFEYEISPWESYDTPTPLLRDKQGTEFVFMGNNPKDDTWTGYNSLCVRPRPGYAPKPTDTGYPIAKYLDNLYWDSPAVDIQVRKYKKGTMTEDGWHKVNGLKNILKKASVYKSFVMADPEQLGLPKGTTAHVAYFPNWKRKDNTGYLSNYITPGFVAMAYRGEVYHDITQSAITGLANVRGCGLQGAPERWVIIFEIPKDCDFVTTNIHRTSLQAKGFQDGSLREACQRSFYYSFEELCPEVHDKNQESYEISVEQGQDLDAFVRNITNDPVFSDLKAHMNAWIREQSVSRLLSTPRGSTDSAPKVRTSTRKGKAFSAFSQLREAHPPGIRVASERDPMSGYVTIDLRIQYSIDFNPTHPLHVQRARMVKDAINSNPKAKKYFDRTGEISDLELDNAVMKHVWREVFFRAMNVYMDENLRTHAAKLERLEPDHLETCWNYGSVKDIVEICTLTRKAMLKNKKAA